MKTYLITWNPKNDDFEELSTMVEQLNRGEAPEKLNWSCSRTKKIVPGDKFYFLKQGDLPRGIIGSGTITSKPNLDDNWRQDNSNKIFYVDLQFEALLNVKDDSNQILNKKELEKISAEQGVNQHWTPFSSGVSLLDEIVPTVDLLWKAKLEQVNSQHLQNLEEEVYAKEEPSITEREGLIKSRVGQGKYRAKLLLRLQNRCAVTNVCIPSILIASHIKPWKDSDDLERIDVNNGILLSPNLDALFDRHLISFNEKGRILVEKNISKDKCKLLGINENMKLRMINKEIKNYLIDHRNKLKERNSKN